MPYCVFSAPPKMHQMNDNKTTNWTTANKKNQKKEPSDNTACAQRVPISLLLVAFRSKWKQPIESSSGKYCDKRNEQWNIRDCRCYNLWCFDTCNKESNKNAFFRRENMKHMQRFKCSLKITGLATDKIDQFQIPNPFALIFLFQMKNLPSKNWNNFVAFGSVFW